VIVADVLTDGNVDDAKTALDLIDEFEGDIRSITADAVYDTLAIYAAATARSAKVVVPPIKTATRSRRQRFRSNTRDRTIIGVKEIGRRRWEKELGYHRQASICCDWLVTWGAEGRSAAVSAFMHQRRSEFTRRRSQALEDSLPFQQLVGCS